MHIGCTNYNKNKLIIYVLLVGEIFILLSGFVYMLCKGVVNYKYMFFEGLVLFVFYIVFSTNTFFTQVSADKYTQLFRKNFYLIFICIYLFF